MTEKAQSVRDLAEAADLDLDEVLLSLWDAGLENVEDVDDILRGQDLKTACRILNIPNAKQMLAVTYWSQLWELDEDKTRIKLRELGVPISENARTLPKGGLKRLRSSQALPLPSNQNSATVEPATRTAPEPEFTFRTPGHRRDITTLGADDVLKIHEALVEDFRQSADPIDPPGVRDMNLLESAAFRPATALGDALKYPTVEMAGAALLHSLVLNHPFHNGNKRTAIVSALVFFDKHDILLTCNESALFRLVLRLAQHQLVPTDWSMRDDREVIEIADWICTNSRAMQRGERRLKWNELRRILSSLGCVVGTRPVPGNKIKITRQIEERRLFGIKRQRVLNMTVGYQSGGAEVDQPTLANIRKVLFLDDDHGYDSSYFYGSDKRTPDEFIAQYRTLLKRLAKL